MATRVIELTTEPKDLGSATTLDVEGNALALAASPKRYSLSRSGGSMAFYGEGSAAPSAGHALIDVYEFNLPTQAGDKAWAWSADKSIIVITETD